MFKNASSHFLTSLFKDVSFINQEKRAESTLTKKGP